MAKQIAAHERVLRLRSDLNDAVERGDDAEARKLRPKVEQAQREWHRLARAADDAMRETRSR